MINPQYPDIRHLLDVSIGVTYTDGVSVGGVEVSTREHFDALAESVTAVGPQVHSDAAQVAAAANTFTETDSPGQGGRGGGARAPTHGAEAIQHGQAGRERH